MAEQITLTLTRTEASALSEAVRYLQQEAHEGTGRHITALSRVQKKLGDPIGCGAGQEPS